MFSREFKCCGMGAAALLCLSASNSFAQTLSEVVVSASRAEQRSFDTPASIQAVGREVLDVGGAQVNASEALNRVPGITALNRQNYAQDLQLSIRGFGARSTFGVRGVRLLVDGIPATMPDGQGQSSTISLPSTERIEVLRGPMAQLYGNAAGGVVQAFTMEAPATPQVTGSAFGGSYGTHRYGLQAAGREGDLHYVSDFSNFSTIGYRDHSAAHRVQLNNKFSLQVSDQTRVTVVANVFDQPKSQDPGGLNRADFTRNPTSVASTALSQDTMKAVSQNQLGTVVDHRIDDQSSLMTRVYAGQRSLFNRLGIIPSAQVSATSAGGIVDLARDYAGYGLQYTKRTPLAQGELRTVAGFDYDQMVDRRKGYLNTGGVQGALKRDEDNIGSSFATFVQSTWMMNPSWSLTGGFRSTTVRFRVNDYFVIPGNPDDSGSVRYAATTPVVGLTHHLNDDVNLFVNVGRGFETPSFSELAYRNSGSGPNFGLQSATGQHTEVGMKARFGPDHRVDLSLYTVGTDNELAVDQNSGGRSTYRNVGRTWRQGVELAWQGRYEGGVTSYLALTTIDAKFKDSVGNVVAGRNLPGLPDRFIFGEVAWRPWASGPLSGLQGAVEMIQSGRLFVNDSNSDAADGYTVFNLRLSHDKRYGPWRVREFVRVDNFTDRNYAGSVIVNESNSRFFEAAPRRNYLVGVSATYSLR